MSYPANLVQVEVRSVYGNDMIYPVNVAAKCFANIAGRKTLDSKSLANIRLLGFTVEQVPLRMNLP